MARQKRPLFKHYRKSLSLINQLIKSRRQPFLERPLLSWLVMGYAWIESARHLLSGVPPAGSKGTVMQSQQHKKLWSWNLWQWSLLVDAHLPGEGPLRAYPDKIPSPAPLQDKISFGSSGALSGSFGIVHFAAHLQRKSKSWNIILRFLKKKMPTISYFDKISYRE